MGEVTCCHAFEQFVGRRVTDLTSSDISGDSTDRVRDSLQVMQNDFRGLRHRGLKGCHQELQNQVDGLGVHAMQRVWGRSC